jgi:hypothetical protein
MAMAILTTLSNGRRIASKRVQALSGDAVY